MKRHHNIQCIRETRMMRYSNLLKDNRRKFKNGAVCGIVNPYTTANVPISGFGYLIVTCSDDNDSSYASGSVSPQSVQMTINSTNQVKSVPGINVFLSTMPVVQIINQSNSVANYSITLQEC
jgi:hypothetical protein